MSADGWCWSGIWLTIGGINGGCFGVVMGGGTGMKMGGVIGGGNGVIVGTIGVSVSDVGCGEILSHWEGTGNSVAETGLELVFRTNFSFLFTGGFTWAIGCEGCSREGNGEGSGEIVGFFESVDCCLSGCGSCSVDTSSSSIGHSVIDARI